MNRKFLVDGVEVELIETLKNGFLISVVVECFDGEGMPTERICKPEIVQEIFDIPPVVKFNMEISDLMRKKHHIEREIQELNREKDSKVKESQEFDKSLAVYPKLARLKDFISGKITHYVKIDYGSIEIIDFKEAKSEEESYTRKLKLLTLFGDSNGDLNWNLNNYRDGSGWNKEVTPCCSYEEALKVVNCFERIYTENILNPPKKRGVHV